MEPTTSATGQVAPPSQVPLRAARMGVPIPAEPDTLLVNILQWARAHDSKGEKDFLGYIRDVLDLYGVHPSNAHTEHAIVVVIGEPVVGDSRPLFACHVDTCDGNVGPPTKKLVYDANLGLITLEQGSGSACLGADDGVGVWILLNMIEAKVPGTYVFHRGEEVGGLGARGMAKDAVQFIGAHSYAVEFDRGGTTDIITHQRGGVRCASNAFAKDLAEEFGKVSASLKFSPNSGGSYTDVFEYRSLLSECVNVSVGYKSQHSPNEWLDYCHALALKDACLKLPWHKLKTHRDHKADAKQEAASRIDWAEIRQQGAFWGYEPRKASVPAKRKPVVEPTVMEELEGLSREDLEYMEVEALVRCVIHLRAELAGARARIDILESYL